MKHLLLILSAALSMAFLANSQESKHYVKETDPLAAKKLEQWQDMKFGFMMHWGLYSQWGIVESWSLCGEDEGWCQRTGVYAGDYETYKQAYRNIKKEFNPVKFNPDLWAEAAKKAGMRYLINTTKHHDGFCMFDTKTTDFKITSPESPFSSNPKANIVKETFNAFRNQGLMIGAYFSKPDWNSPYYWWPYFPTPDRHVNYNPVKYPERWQKFKDWTYTQIEELMTGYGSVDILWLDGAWVRPLANMPKEYESWAKKLDYNQDVDITRIVSMARKHQPGLIVVDRWVSGLYENYLTPEQKIPEKALDVPWESCMTMATSWGYVKNDRFKPTRQLIHLLVDIIAKGGNLLLDVGPTPEGTLPDTAYQRMKEIGEWMTVNGKAIYGTRPIAPYKEKNICYTHSKTGMVYALYLAQKEENTPPASIVFGGILPKKGATVQMLGVQQPLEWEIKSGRAIVKIPAVVQQRPPCKDAWVFVF
ncbi:MAG: alpha-L-fucosidase [bacterium]